MKKSKNEKVSFGSNMHILHIEVALATVGEKLKDLCAIVGDNCRVNKCLATKLDIPLIGCRSHIFNLAVNAHLKEYKVVLTKINKVMKKLKSASNYVTLLEVCPLKSINQNDTRWSSTYDMLKRYFELEPFVKEMENMTIYLLDNMEHFALKNLMAGLESLQSVTVALQSSTMNI
jgi:hypothetical protein